MTPMIGSGGAMGTFANMLVKTIFWVKVLKDTVLPIIRMYYKASKRYKHLYLKFKCQFIIITSYLFNFNPILIKNHPLLKRLIFIWYIFIETYKIFKFISSIKIFHSSFSFVTFMKTYSKVECDTFQSLIEFLSEYSSNPKASGDSNILTIFNIVSKSSIPMIKFPPLLST